MEPIDLVDIANYMNIGLVILAIVSALGMTATAFVSVPLEFCKVTSSMTVLPIPAVFYLGFIAHVLGSSVNVVYIRSSSETTALSPSSVIVKILAYTSYTLANMALIFTFVFLPVVIQITLGKFSCWGIGLKILIVGCCTIGGLTLLHHMCMTFTGRVNWSKTRAERGQRKQVCYTFGVFRACLSLFSVGSIGLKQEQKEVKENKFVTPLASPEHV